jgi:hypothetical protein
MNIYRDLHITNDFGQKLDLGTFLMLPDADKRKMAEGRLDVFAIYARKLGELSNEQRVEYERMYRMRQEDKTNRVAQIIRG